MESACTKLIQRHRRWCQSKGLPPLPASDLYINSYRFSRYSRTSCRNR